MITSDFNVAYADVLKPRSETGPAFSSPAFSDLHFPVLYFSRPVC